MERMKPVFANASLTASQTTDYFQDSFADGLAHFT